MDGSDNPKKSQLIEKKKLKRPWRSFKEIQSIAKNDMIKRMASANYKGIGAYIKIKIRRMLEELNSTSINLEKVSVLCYNGIVEDCRGLRSTVWKLLLYHLPLNSEQWVTAMESKNKAYVALREEYIPTLIPTNLSEGRALLWEDVEKDIRRTRSDVAFFVEPVVKHENIDVSFLYDLTQLLKNDLTKEQQKKYIITHADILGRILYIYGCRHPDVMYVQGMNELLAVIYYVFAKDCITGYEKYIESDAFFTFENLMDELKDAFKASMDRTEIGIHAKLKSFEKLIQRSRNKIWNTFKENEVTIEVFAIRWQMLLLCQDFRIPDVTRLWDSLLSDAGRFNFFLYVCLALLVNVEDDILKGEFDVIIKAINSSASKIEMKKLIEMARELLEKDVERDEQEFAELDKKKKKKNTE